MRTIKFLIVICALALLAGCGGYIAMGGVDPSDGNDGVDIGDGSVVFNAPVVTVDPNRRATVNTESDEGADSWDVSIDDGDFGDITPDADCDDDGCEYDIPGLDPNQLYEVNVRYWKNGDLSATTSVLVNTAFKELIANGHSAEENFGESIAVGDVDGDGDPDIAAGPGFGLNGQVDIYLGGAQLSPLEPWATFKSNNAANRYGNDVHLADVTCDGLLDLIVGEFRNVTGEGIVNVYANASIAAGANVSETTRDFKFRDNDLNSDFGRAFDTVDDGTGCHDLIIGAPDAHGAAGDVFRVPNTAFVFELDVDDTFRIAGGPGPIAGTYMANVGDRVMFNTEYNVAAPHRDTVLRFTTAPGADWTTIATNFNGSHEFALGHLTGSDFYTSEGVDVGGGFLNIYTGYASNIPANILTSDTRDGFGVSAAVGEVYQAQPGLELLVGTNTHILVYFGYVEGAGLSDVTPDAILNIPGRNIRVADMNGDGYNDLITANPFADIPVSNAGAVHLNY